MLKIKQSPKLPAEKRRDQLLKAAERVIIKRGYRHTTMDLIARQAKLTKGAVYFHFKNKEEIFFELVKRVTSRSFELFQDVEPGTARPSTFLRILFEGKGKVASDLNDLGSNLDFWVQAINVPRIKSYLNSLDAMFFEIFEKALKPEYLSDRKTTRHLAVTTLALIDGLMVRGILNAPTVDYEKQIVLLDQLFESWVSVHGDTTRSNKR